MKHIIQYGASSYNFIFIFAQQKVKGMLSKAAIPFLLILVLTISCTLDKPVKSAFSLDDTIHANTRLLQVAMRDNFNPPQASRVYVYPHIGQYLVLQQAHPNEMPDIGARLNGLKSIPTYDSSKVEPQLAALLTFCKVAKKVVHSEHYMESLKDTIMLKAIESGYSQKLINRSEAYAEELTNHLSDWIKEDGYFETRTYDRFTSSISPGEWRETPPDYMAALEPNWQYLRPLVIDSAGFYRAPPPPEYSPDKDSDFYKMVMKVYEESKTIDSIKEEIAWFWDDNPNITEHTGHLMTKTHKYAPPGHWMNIISQVCEKENVSVQKASKAYTLASIAMFDGVISCWYEKYTTNLVRPITYIQEYIDPFWTTILQTPPFPEYTSGHSVVSASAAEVMTQLFGDEYTFTDNTQLLFDMNERTFESFHDAAWEVSMSRFYGGIHYMEGIEEGNKQGRFIGDYIITELHQKD